MANVVTFQDYTPSPRYDGTAWAKALIEEAPAADGPWTLLDTINFTDPDVDPARPKTRSFSINNATLAQGWYRVTFEDAGSNSSLPTAPVHNAPNEILATLDDINANLDGDIITADWMNTALLQISVARIVRGYLARVVDRVTLFSWGTPETTPDIIREIAAKLIAAQLFFDKTSRSAVVIEDTHYAQRLYNQAMELLNGIIAGTVDIDNIIVDSGDTLTEDDFWPNSATDRAFTRSKRLYGQNA